MADEVDMTDERTTAEKADTIARISRAAASIPAGEPGECDLCGEWSGRLVEGVCAPCRDRHNLP